MEGPLFQACEKGDKPKFLELYDTDNSVLQQRTTGSLDTPLHLASRSKHEELALTIHGLQPDMAMATNNKGDTPIHEAARVGEMKIVKQLLDACPCVAYMLNLDKESALYIACYFGYSAVALELCGRMNFRAWDEIGASCLRIAASQGYTDITQKILEENRSLASRKDDSGFSAMHLASREGKDEVIKTLIEKDSNLSFLKDNDERTPLHLAVDKKQFSVVTAFLSHTSLTNAQVTQLINGVDKDGNTVLHLAAINGYLEIAKDLVGRDGMNVTSANKRGMTARDILQRQPATSGRDDLIKKLVARERVIPKEIPAVQQSLMVVAALIVTITFQAGLNPPGGQWQDSNGRNQTNDNTGKAIHSETSLWIFSLFMASDALAFIVSVALIPIIMILREEIMFYVNLLVVVALIATEVAFILGLFMVSDRKFFYRVEVCLFVLVTLAGVVWVGWKLKPSRTCR